MRARLWREVTRRAARRSPARPRLRHRPRRRPLRRAGTRCRRHRLVAADDPQDQSAGRRARSAQATGCTLRRLGIHEIDQLAGEQFDAIYSDLGPLNCTPKLELVARELRRSHPRQQPDRLGHRAHLSWEWLYYAAHGHLRQVRTCEARPTPCRSGSTAASAYVWTQYYTPGEFADAFAPYFTLKHYEKGCSSSRRRPI